MSTTIRNTDVLFNDNTTQGTAGFTGYRNRIINGNMAVNQRGLTQTGELGAYTADRWQYIANSIVGGAATVGWFNDGNVSTTGTAHLVLNTTTAKASLAAPDVTLLLHTIEANNMDDFKFGTPNAKTITLSFKGSITTVASATISVAVRNAGATRSYVQTVVMTQVGQRFTITIPGDTAGTWLQSGTGVGMTVTFAHCSGTDYRTASLGVWQTGNFIASTSQTNLLATFNAAIVITDVQLETGSVATPFEHRAYGTELGLCYRYCQVYTWNENNPMWNGNVWQGNNFYGVMHLHTALRESPHTVTVTNPLNCTIFSSGTTYASSGITPTGQSATTGEFVVLHSAGTMVTGRAGWVRCTGGTLKVTYSADI